jgi:adenylylsulfate kinase
MKYDITWHKHKIKREDREKRLSQKSALLWFTGLSASGKSTIADFLEDRLFKEGKISYILDGDNIRHGLNNDLSFSKKDRKENIRRIGEVAALFVDAGLITMACFISPYEKDRHIIRQKLGKDFIEIYVRCSLEECERRDPKGLYNKARKSKIKDFTGVSHPYEEPKKPEITIDSDKLSVQQASDKIYQYLKSEGII